ncbi:MAG: GNAT family N-acetyltransferase [Ignavibacteria bacterium]|nr:GNAT family N-acetyltransferase [Ignavibacteria bacterium]MBT8382165.1 GNAT family N-acetyltransferase [Ignavibacteria bacterium]MBT8392271.1 GNAT family N-acetyltransferase [Ignavibacteria bacterium]NNJ53617.1 N-acetyltransferase [Ignavibacteriaceae bacterium]NNL20394.1 N-acetyltransferase [Ignavibacteriaceae bacterium]
MLIRTANENNFEDIIKIYNHAVDEKFATADLEHVTVESKKDWFAEHSSDTYPIFVAEENDEIIGWCALSPHRPGRRALKTVAEISYYIHKDYRKQGVATSLITHTIDAAKILDFKNLISILLDLNKSSIYILEKFGFEKWGHLPNVAKIGETICGQFIYGRKI